MALARTLCRKAENSRVPGLAGRFLAFFCFVTFVWFWIISPPLSFPPARAATDSQEKKQQIEKIEKDLNREREEFHKFDQIEDRLLNELSLLEKEIEGKRQNLKGLEEEASRIKKELRENQGKVKNLEASLKDLEGRLGRRLDAFYRYAKRAYVRLLATSDGLDTLRKRFKYLRGLLAADLALLQETSTAQKERRKEISLVRVKLLDLEKIEKEVGDHVSKLKEDIDRKVALLMKTHKEKEFHETGVKELELAAQKLRETIARIEKRDEKQTEIPSDFKKCVGKLPMPLDGRIVREGAWLQGGLKGITLAGRPGAEVKAVYEGRIDFSGYLKGQGEIVIINHGSRYFTVSAQLGRRQKKEGDIVRAGEVIGFLGNPASPQDARLYFEIRKGGKNLDPLRWLKVH